jgi:hypothetical protein
MNTGGCQDIATIPPDVDADRQFTPGIGDAGPVTKENVISPAASECPYRTRQTAMLGFQSCKAYVTTMPRIDVERVKV